MWICMSTLSVPPKYKKLTNVSYEKLYVILSENGQPLYLDQTYVIGVIGWREGEKEGR